MIFTVPEIYKKVERSIVCLIVANFFFQLINSAFMLTLNIYMSELGYTDPEIADYVSYRFGVVFLCAIPLGLWAKGRRLRPIYFLMSFLIPIVSLLIVQAVSMHIPWLLKLLMMTWGLVFSGLFILTLPYIIRNSDKKNHTASISLNASSWSISTIFCGLAIFILNALNPDFFDEKRLLELFSLLSFCSVYFIYKMDTEEVVEQGVEKGSLMTELGRYDWALIGRMISPVLPIAIGAGLTIPFINLFFHHSFGLTAGQYSVLGSAASVIVAIAMLSVPKVKERFGYEAITITQSLSVIALIIMASTDFFANYSFALYLAIFCFLVRQPLMNMANPMTAEMSMYYVGKQNQEMVVAINSSVWSGSWFFSAKIFSLLRGMNLPYGQIFYITSLLYIGGILVWFLLIKDYRKRVSKGIITE